MDLLARLTIENEGVLKTILEVKKAEAALSRALSDLEHVLSQYSAEELKGSEEPPKS